MQIYVYNTFVIVIFYILFLIQKTFPQKCKKFSFRQTIIITEFTQGPKQTTSLN